MITYLRHKEIDKERWDLCIRNAVNGRIYASSWYLDLVSPGWDALADTEYESVFPLTHRRKAGIDYLYQPFFTQQLGLFSRAHLTEALLDEFLKSIPEKFKWVDIQLNSLNKVNPLRYDTVFRLNHELDLINSYENLSKNYSQNTLRNIRKASQMGVNTGRKVEVDELITLFREHYGKKEGVLQFRDYETLRNLLQYLQRNVLGMLLGAYSATGQLSAASFFIKEPSRVTYLFAASAPEARENGAMFLLIDQFIREHAGQALTLDFEGGNDPDLGRFYKSFGAAESPYCQLRINRLPWVFRQGLYFTRKLRHWRKTATFAGKNQ